MKEGTGAGLHGQRLGFKRSFPLGQYVTVFQAEVMAINNYVHKNMRRVFIFQTTKNQDLHPH